MSKTEGKLLLRQIISTVALCVLFHAAAWHDVVAAQQPQRAASVQQQQAPAPTVRFDSGTSRRIR